MADEKRGYYPTPYMAELSIIPTKELDELREKVADYEDLYDTYMDLYREYDTMRLRAENLERRLREIAEVLDK